MPLHPSTVGWCSSAHACLVRGQALLRSPSQWSPTHTLSLSLCVSVCLSSACLPLCPHAWTVRPLPYCSRCVCLCVLRALRSASPEANQMSQQQGGPLSGRRRLNKALTRRRPGSCGAILKLGHQRLHVVVTVLPSATVRFVASVANSATQHHCRGRCEGRVPGGGIEATMSWRDAKLGECILPPVVRATV